MTTEPKISLPKGWSQHVQLAILHVVALARTAITAARGCVAKTGSSAELLRAELDAAHEENTLLREEIRLKDLRMSRVPSRRRPHFRPIERLVILALRAARGWSKRETAKRFLLGPATIVGWTRRLDEGGEGALLEVTEPANRFPDFVREIVRRLKTLCPTMGKKRIAQTLARAGLELAVSTVGRMLKESDKPDVPEEDGADADAPTETETTAAGSPVKADRPHECWQVDLTLVPLAGGFWVPWLPFALPPLWPFSRRVLDFAVFAKEPTSLEIRMFLGRVVAAVGESPKFLISDKGTQFDCGDYRKWCTRRGVRPRYASSGSLRATAIVERFIRSLKDEWLRRIPIPWRREKLRALLVSYRAWFAESRPHQGLDGRTPRGDEKEGGPHSKRTKITTGCDHDDHRRVTTSSTKQR